MADHGQCPIIMYKLSQCFSCHTISGFTRVSVSCVVEKYGTKTDKTLACVLAMSLQL